MSNSLILDIGDKYTYTFSNGKQLITRNGKLWRDETGDGFLCLMAHQLATAEEDLDIAIKIIEDSGVDFDEVYEQYKGED